MLRLKLQESGNPAAGFTRLQKNLMRKLGGAAVKVNRAGVGILRADVKAAGLGNRTANTWRAETFPVPNPSRTLRPAVQIYSNADYLIRAYEEAGTIRHKGVRWLAIPTENVKGTAAPAKAGSGRLGVAGGKSRPRKRPAAMGSR